MSAFALNNVITLDGHKYAVKINTYNRSWVREFNTQVTAGVIRLTFIDRGPGIENYKMTLEIRTWPVGSLPRNLGVTESWDQQLQNLEASYGKINSSLQFIDPFGQAPVIPGTSTSSGIYFIDFLEVIPEYATLNEPAVQAIVELKNATGIIS